MSLRALPAFAAALLWTACAGAQAQAAFDEPALRAFLHQQVAATAIREGFSRFEVQMGTPDTAYALAPCRRAEPFMPATARTWGKTTVGLRCIDGAAWSLLVPATVAVWGHAVVAAAPLRAGTVLAAQDLLEQEVDLTREPPGVARDAQALIGLTLTRATAAGKPFRPDATRAPLAVQAGDTVRLLIDGSGFQITASARALAPAAAGQSVRVRTELGKILTGVARDGRVVEVAL